MRSTPAAGGALAFEDEIDAEFARGVKAGARRVLVSSAHDALRSLSGLEAGRASGRQSDRSIELIPAAKRFLDEVARAGGWGLECEKMLSRLRRYVCGAHGQKLRANAGAGLRRTRS
jgi:hypothetical protein